MTLFTFFMIPAHIHEKVLIPVVCSCSYEFASSKNQNFSTIVAFKISLQVQRPSRTTYFRIYSSDGAIVYSKDVSLYFNYRILPNSTVQIKLDGNVNFQEKKSYYVILGPGFAKSTALCGVESQAVMDSNQWKFTISEIR